MFEWDEPLGYDPLTHCTCSVTREDAIKFQRAYVERHRPEFIYKDDQQALDDFMAVRWARETGESP